MCGARYTGFPSVTRCYSKCGPVGAVWWKGGGFNGTVGSNIGELEAFGAGCAIRSLERNFVLHEMAEAGWGSTLKRAENILGIIAATLRINAGANGEPAEAG